jgi:hypothetical protein
VDRHGDIVDNKFDLTDEESLEVQKAFEIYKGYVADKENLDELQRAVTGQALYFYANEQIQQSLYVASNEQEKRKYVSKAIASMGKAFIISQIPIYLYDLACLIEMDGRGDAAKDKFKNFLELQSNYKPSKFQEVFSKTLQRDINAALRHAKEKDG